MNQETQSSKPKKQQEIDQPFKSLAVVTLAGFGGSLAGLSISRSRPTISKNLPYIWAISCATFAGIIECSKIISPTEILLQAFKDSQLSVGNTGDGDIVSPPNIEESGGNTTSMFKTTLPKFPMEWKESHTKTLGDYALGGLIAGSIFRGGYIAPSSPQNVEEQRHASKSDFSPSASEKQKKVIGKGKVLTLGNHSNIGKIATREIQRDTMRAMVHQSHLPKLGILTGLVPGLMLGILAGGIQIFIQEAERLLEEHTYEEVDQIASPITMTKEEEEEIETKVKNMSLSEIEKEIATLKKQLGK